MVEGRIDVEQYKSLLKTIISRQMPEPGNYETSIQGVRLYRRDQINTVENALYQPMIVKMIQGRKRLAFGAEEYFYGGDEIMATGVDVPGLSAIIEAQPDRPSLCIVIDLDKNLLAQLSLEIPPVRLPHKNKTGGVLVRTVEPEMLDAYLRLAELFDTPQKIPVFAPMIIKEIHYLLLAGPEGDRLRSFHTHGSQNNEIFRTISWLKENLSVSVTIEELAERANMAPSTFHRHFRDVTTLSPLQFQKRLRLHEAQRLMLAHGMDGNSASMSVGYENKSQFNREYKRLFGEPPHRDVKRLREDLSLPKAPPSGRHLTVTSY